MQTCTMKEMFRGATRGKERCVYYFRTALKSNSAVYTELKLYVQVLEKVKNENKFIVIGGLNSFSEQKGKKKHTELFFYSK